MRRVLFVSLLLFLSFIWFVVVQFIVFSDKRLHIVFCDVGQGDAILINTPSGIVSLVDGGPDETVESCLSKHLPFWQRTIRLMLLSHPHADHYIGMLGILDRYRVLQFATEKLNNDTILFRSLLDRLKAKDLLPRYLYAGDLFRFRDGVVIEVLGPTKEYLSQTSPGGKIGEKTEFASLVLLVTYHDFSVLLTGDSQASGIEEAMKRINLPSISVLQVPHHGSRTGLNEGVLKRLKPKLAVISVGKNNYGHPSPQILDLLIKNRISQKQTIKDGDIEIASDGVKWQIL
ncbi:MAG: MBL fold metallo-hydrolase [bacterium]|nr:MBL fold metallo-hydrolase [bacterium]